MQVKTILVILGACGLFLIMMALFSAHNVQAIDGCTDVGSGDPRTYYGNCDDDNMVGSYELSSWYYGDANHPVYYKLGSPFVEASGQDDSDWSAYFDRYDFQFSSADCSGITHCFYEGNSAIAYANEDAGSGYYIAYTGDYISTVDGVTVHLIVRNYLWDSGRINTYFTLDYASGFSDSYKYYVYADIDMGTSNTNDVVSTYDSGTWGDSVNDVYYPRMVGVTSEVDEMIRIKDTSGGTANIKYGVPYSSIDASYAIVLKASTEPTDAGPMYMMNRQDVWEANIAIYTVISRVTTSESAVGTYGTLNSY